MDVIFFFWRYYFSFCRYRCQCGCGVFGSVYFVLSAGGGYVGFGGVIDTVGVV